MTLLHVRKTQVHVWRIPRCGGMNGVSVGTGCLRLSRVDRVNSRTSAHSVEECADVFVLGWIAGAMVDDNGS